MEKALEKLSLDIVQFLEKLNSKKKLYSEAIQNDYELGKVKEILLEIRGLQSAITEAVDEYYKLKNKYN